MYKKDKKRMTILTLLLCLTAVFVFVAIFLIYNSKYLTRQKNDEIPEKTIVRIQVEQSFGSGIILKYNKKTGKLLICANTHLLEEAENVQVTLPDDSEWVGQVVGLVENTDLGYVEVDLGNQRPGPFHEAVIRADDESGMEVVLIGSTDGPGKTVVNGYIEESSFFYEPLNNTFLFVKAGAVHGMSGGGVFDGRGRLLGMISGGNEETEEVLCVPVEMIVNGMEVIDF